MTDTLKIKSIILASTGEAASKSDSFPWASVFPDLLWIFFWLILIFLTKDALFVAINVLLTRLKHGAAIKIGTFEMEAIKVSATTAIDDRKFRTRNDENNEMDHLRMQQYEGAKFIMLVHKIFKSQKDGQLYDILIYVKPHREADLGQVESVEYFFGKYWENKIFKSTDICNGFAIATSAYGSFLCSAKINYRDSNNESFITYRYIDFEMGETAPLIIE